VFLKTRIKEPPGSKKGPEVFQAVIRLVQNNVTHPPTVIYSRVISLFDHHGYISKPDIFFLDNPGYQRDARRGFGLLSDTRPTLVTTYWKRRFAVPGSPPS
jgi:hypothetical protein